jgi:ABC-type transport system involved in cytochrome bd biosynthesis fused ATPase/permease subunit
MITVRHLHIQFSEQPLFSDFSFSVAAGEKAVVSGKSGSGKSTLLHALMGFVPAASGEIEINGVRLEAATVDGIRRQVAWLPQELGLGLETGEALFYYPYTFRANRPLRPEPSAVSATLGRLGLSGEILQRGAADISGGEKQRLLAAALILMGRKVLLLDEPTSALDRGSAELLMDAVSELDGVSVLAATHDPLWQKGFDRVISLD